MIRKGGLSDTARAATWFVRWWREDGASAYASTALPDTHRGGWGFDLEWEITQDELASSADVDRNTLVQRKMEACIDAHTRAQAQESEEISPTQVKKRELEERKKRYRDRSLKRLAAKRGKR